MQNKHEIANGGNCGSPHLSLSFQHPLALQISWHSSYLSLTAAFLPWSSFCSSHEPISSELLYLCSAGVVCKLLHLYLMNCYNPKEPPDEHRRVCVQMPQKLGHLPVIIQNSIQMVFYLRGLWSNYSPLFHTNLFRNFIHCLTLPLGFAVILKTFIITWSYTAHCLFTTVLFVFSFGI